MSNLSVQKNIRTAASAILLSWLTLAACLLSPIIELNTKYITFDFLTYAFISFLVFYAAFFAGCISGPWKKITVSHKVLLKFTIAIMLTALASRYIDRFYLRPVASYFSIAEVRKSRTEGSNLLSIMSILLLPLGISLFLKIKNTGRTIKRHHSAIFLVTFTLITLDVLSTGSRGILLSLLIFLFYKRLTIRLILILIPTLILLSGTFFLVRFSALTPTTDIQATLISVSTKGYAEFVPITQKYMNHLLESGLSYLFFPIIQANQYFAHGIFEFAYLYQSGPSLQFDPSRVIPQISKIYSFSSRLERENLYYTAPGTFYIAFGVYSIVASLVAGVLLGAIYKRAIKESTGAKGLVLFCLFLTPFVNNIAGFDLHFYLLAIYITSSIRIAPQHLNSVTINHDIPIQRRDPSCPIPVIS